MGRAPCCDKDGLKKGPWLPEEDQKLVDYIRKHGPGNWRTLPKKAGLQRCGKSCRLRWSNYLRPDIKRGRFSFEEEEAIIQLHSILGNKWSAIAAKLPGRTDNEIKNYWNTHIRKRMLRMGLDPVTHTRRLEFLDQNSNSQLNLLNLLGLQTLVNPELLKLASLLSTNHNGNLNFLTQNQWLNNANNNNSQRESRVCRELGNNDVAALFEQSQNQLANQMQNVNPQSQNPINLSSYAGMTATTSVSLPVLPDLVQHPNEISNFENQNQWINNDVHHGVRNLEQDQSRFLSSEDQAIMSAFYDNNSGFQTSENDSDQSEKTPLSSNSMMYDEIDSYCRNLLNLDIPVELFDL